MSRIIGAAAPVVPERFRWALRLLIAAAGVYGAIGVVTLIGQIAQLVSWLQPGARVPVTMTTAFALQTNGGRNVYGGAPFVRDGTSVLATQVSTVLDDVPLINRVWMGTGPILWTLTALAVTALLGLALVRLTGATTFGDRAARPVVGAAAALAIGTTVAQIVDGAVQLGFGVFAWAAPVDSERIITRAGGWSFEFAPLVAACGLLVIALILHRGLALQDDVDGLV